MAEHSREQWREAELETHQQPHVWEHVIAKQAGPVLRQPGGSGYHRPASAHHEASATAAATATATTAQAACPAGGRRAQSCSATHNCKHSGARGTGRVAGTKGRVAYNSLGFSRSCPRHAAQPYDHPDSEQQDIQDAE